MLHPEKKHDTPCDMKFAAGPPCIIDIPITIPHSLIKSRELIAIVDSIGFASLKKRLLTIDKSSKNKNLEYKLEFVYESLTVFLLRFC
jgi:hypothetical protein